jgi:hypothetical protein
MMKERTTVHNNRSFTLHYQLVSKNEQDRLAGSQTGNYRNPINSLVQLIASYDQYEIE